MKVVAGELLGGEGITVPQGRYKAFAIGPGSDFDQVYIDGELLQAGRVLYHQSQQPKLSYARGSRATATTALGSVAAWTFAWRLELVCFEECDLVVNPGPRNTRRYQQRQNNAGIGTANDMGSNVGAGHILALVVPFSGRKRAVYTATCYAGTARAQTALYGRRWVSPKGDASLVGDYVYYAFSGEGVASVFGALTVPAWNTLAFESNTPALGTGRVIGGTDSEESLDELVLLWAKHNTDSALSCDVFVEIEVSGEEGL